MSEPQLLHPATAVVVRHLKLLLGQRPVLFPWRCPGQRKENNITNSRHDNIERHNKRPDEKKKRRKKNAPGMETDWDNVRAGLTTVWTWANTLVIVVGWRPGRRPLLYCTAEPPSSPNVATGEITRRDISQHFGQQKPEGGKARPLFNIIYIS